MQSTTSSSSSSSSSYVNANFNHSLAHFNSSTGNNSTNFGFLPPAPFSQSSQYGKPMQQYQQHHTQLHQHHHHSAYLHQQQQQHHQQSQLDTALSSLFNADQLLKFAAGLECQQQSSLTADKADTLLPVPELNFDLIGSDLYDLNDDHLAPTSSSSLTSSMHSAGSSTSSTSSAHFLDVNYKSSSNVTGVANAVNSAYSSNTGDDNIVLSLLKNTMISPVESPKHHDTSSSLSTDSGCRSNSFLNDEDSAICSLVVKSTALSIVSGSGEEKNSSSKVEMGKKSVADVDFACTTVSEHMEFTCSNSSPMKLLHVEEEGEEEEEKENHNNSEDEDDDQNNECSSQCDTSVDASEIPDNLSEVSDNEVDQDDSDDDLSDIDLDFKLAEAEEAEKATVLEPLTKYNQVLEEDGTVARKKLNSGIYKSVNETLSLFIEPHDILKKMQMDEFDEYSLFPFGVIDRVVGEEATIGGGCKDEVTAAADALLLTNSN